MNNFFSSVTFDDVANEPFEYDHTSFHPLFQSFVEGIPGKEQYRLYNYINKHFPYTHLTEFGVEYGTSLRVLSHNKTAYAFDIVDNRYGEAKTLPNVSFTLCDAIDAVYLSWLEISSSQLIHFDTVHNGLHEHTWLSTMKKFGYHGTILFDDIYVCPDMIQWWTNISDEKYDLTFVGHHTGTGVVIL